MVSSERSPQSPSAPQPLPYPQRQKQLGQLLITLGIEDLPEPDWQLLDEALVHCSESADRNYERLEFFGDAVLRMAASDYLLENHRDWSVGEMTSVRNVLVSDRALSDIARHYELEQYLVLGSALQIPSQKTNPGQLADSVESLIGALYTMTRSLRWIRPWLEPFWRDKAISVYNDPARQNHKAALQEWTQHHFKALPHYTVIEHPSPVPASDRFAAEVWFKDQCLGQGSGRTRKAAEQAAAKMAFTTRPDPSIFSVAPA